MVEINNLKHDIEALSAEREALRKEVEALEAKRDDLFEGCLLYTSSHSKLVMEFPRKSLAPVSPKVGLKEDFYHSLFHRWEQQDITDGCCVSEKHAETVDTDSESTCWWHTVFEGFNVVVVDACCFVVTEFFSSSLCFET